MKYKRVILLSCFLSLFAAALYGQAVTTQTEETPSFENQITGGETFTGENLPAPDEFAANEETMSSERQRIEMEIKTSTLPELAVWSRSLGLSESGTREALSGRIREFYELPEPENTANENRRVITIESAQISEYFRIEVIDEDYARLRGDVRLSLKDNDTVHRIKAEEILFNRTRNIITARGNVVYEKENGDTVETFRGENITVNIDDWSSIFLDGSSERRLESDGTAYLFSGTVISRTNEDVTILNNARITNANNEEALWSINSSKLWLLPGSDFAIFNAFLKIGEIPVFYIPFFYYPANELIFHPVIGIRSREGAFVQTTTYILGRPRADSTETSSITRILGNSNDMEKERQGLFLRSTGRRVSDPNTISLRALADYYVNLGTYLSLELSVPKTGILDPLDFSLGLGITRTVSLTSMGYTPYAPNYDGTFDWNNSNFLSLSVPFRYRMRLQSSIRTQYGNLFWDLPYYSDPYVNSDFMNRSESMDWMNFIQQRAAENPISPQDEFRSTSYRWNIYGNINSSLPALSPFISRISITDISTTLDFKPIRDNYIFQNNRDAPERDFYAPDKYTIYNFSASVFGSPLTLGGQNQSSQNRTAQQIDNPLKGIGNPIPPWMNEDSVQDSSPAGTLPDELLVPPALNQQFNIPGTGNVNFVIDYQLSPAGTTELQFMSSNWSAFDQVDWNDVQSILTNLGLNGKINFRIDHSSKIFTNEVSFTGSSTWRDYNYLNEEAGIFLDSYGNPDPVKIQAARNQQYGRTNYITSYIYNGTLRPLYDNPVFGQSNLQYEFRGTLVRSRIYTGGSGPELTPVWGALVKERPSENIPGLNIHRFSTNIEANIMDMRQNVSVRMDLPPLDALVAFNSAFRFWNTETKISFGIKRPEESGKWIFEHVYFDETVKFGNISTFTYHMAINPEDSNQITTITSSLSLWDFSALFKAGKTFRYKFTPDPYLGGRWEQYGESTLLPSELAFSYKRVFSNLEIIRNRMNFSIDVDSSLTFDLLRHTNSNFQLEIGFNFIITNFLELRLSATSENNVIFRYFKGIPGMESLTFMYSDGPQNNLFVDLFDSFNFFDDAKRRRSGFKMKSFDLTAIHYLGDWRAEFGVTMYTYLNNSLTPSKYEVTADISFLIQWRPITEIKSDIRYEGGEINRLTVR
ncbi:MAG: LPS-assembly protein LptD [Treponema sp.]|jgi:lipopolysaccharide assembly outer membrane protein LptD (OstA)|nr:LPS-assembly protein LptD [Treponema sp.]